jgi:hypothetical protein
VSDAQGAFILNPAPSRIGSSDGISGSIVVQGDTQITAGATANAGALFAAASGSAAIENGLSTEITTISFAPRAVSPILDEVFQEMLEQTAEAAAQWLGSVRFDRKEFDARINELEDFITGSFAGLTRPAASRDPLASDLETTPGKKAALDAGWLLEFAQELGNRSNDRANALIDTLQTQPDADELLASVFRLDEYFAQTAASHGQSEE